MTTKSLEYHSQKALETASLKGQKVVVILNDGTCFVGYIINLFYAYSKRDKGFTNVVSLDCDPHEWAASDVWRTREPEHNFEIDEIQSIQIVHRSVTPMEALE